ncbi:hypothetical protein KO561_14940 [Radiobacillus kanasensis]|uniref:hypothetical protein n=1 Tax=Radiobacillus kanasensis TaxID=2844358 RepID=UPI001E496162|nr:hypothetical protein [Radiobacillus kanasensis]UFT98482.1 hypothetical protein KO561_14940 [Radiobacillus kanasensis]
MKDFILMIAAFVNGIHDFILDTVGLHLTDKALHFWILGFIGIVTFFIVLSVFTLLSKLKFSITILSFVYTFTIMIVLVFAIELQQAITNRGNMEFADAVIGLWGFVAFFLVYTVLALIILGIVRLIKGKKRKTLFY